MDDWLALDRAHCWHPYTQHATAPTPLAVAKAEGSWLTLADGTRMLDAISSWWCCLHGHGHPRLVEALHEQARTLDHVLFAGCTHEPAAALAAELVALAPPGLDRVFFSDNGSTSIEVALKASFQSAVLRGEGHRKTFLALEGGYHGDTFGAMAVSDPDPFFEHYAPLLFDVVRIDPDLAELDAMFTQCGHHLVAFVVEPRVRGAAGMRPVSDAFLRAARKLCDHHGVALIADEVFTGFGRTGDLFACGGAGVTPDALCLSKGLTSGMLPLAVTLFPEARFETFLHEDADRMLFHGHTYTANPLACAVARASLQLVHAERTPERLALNGRRMEAALLAEDGLEDCELRRIGGIVALELRSEQPGYLDTLGSRLHAASRAHSPDVLLRPLGNVLYAVPPACTSDAECALIAERMAQVARAALRVT